jgi:lipoprotein-anchoring transpeptidase ErfK/SrfK
MRDYPADYWPSANRKSRAWVREHYETPSAFIRERRQLTVPAQAPRFVLALKRARAVLLFEHGNVLRRYEAALGQSPTGPKLRQGDNRVPEGLYRICAKTRGPFPSDALGGYGEFLGTRWIKIDFPNRFDAERALAAGIIDRRAFAAIVRAADTCQGAAQKTALGGGIGFHGWKGEWSDTGERALTWGCISLHTHDLEELYDLVSVGDLVLIVA